MYVGWSLWVTCFYSIPAIVLLMLVVPPVISWKSVQLIASPLSALGMFGEFFIRKFDFELLKSLVTFSRKGLIDALILFE